MKLYYEALSKIPPEFIDDETRCCTFGDCAVMLANPKFPPMQYCESDKIWKRIGFNPGDWKITQRIANIEAT